MSRCSALPLPLVVWVKAGPCGLAARVAPVLDEVHDAPVLPVCLRRGKYRAAPRMEEEGHTVGHAHLRAVYVPWVWQCAWLRPQ